MPNEPSSTQGHGRFCIRECCVFGVEKYSHMPSTSSLAPVLHTSRGGARLQAWNWVSEQQWPINAEKVSELPLGEQGSSGELVCRHQRRLTHLPRWCICHPELHILIRCYQS
ncbi:hypothetical protein PIB30_089247 [Stylosanthes scabra]|uniref:Uncharacterized protein n=1 Tax=Stylosanthes scabra TaxID=79078 RepID=A0ABU6SUA7_9FABA|nr:hypothetical protein [Stylosanthes scabra]